MQVRQGPVGRYNGDMSRATALPPDIENRLAALGDALSPVPSVVFGYLFGSAACGRLRPLSDVDVAVYVDERADLSCRERTAARPRS